MDPVAGQKAPLAGAIRVLDEGRRPDRADPEPAGDLVHRLLGLAPADRPVIEYGRSEFIRVQLA